MRHLGIGKLGSLLHQVALSVIVGGATATYRPRDLFIDIIAVFLVSFFVEKETLNF